jgi:hypothetical protein
VSGGQLTCASSNCTVRSQFVKTPVVFEWRGTNSDSFSSFPGFWMYRDPHGTYLASTQFGGLGVRSTWNGSSLQVIENEFTQAGDSEYTEYATVFSETELHDFRVELRNNFQSVEIDGVEVYRSTSKTLPDETLVSWILWHRYANGVSSVQHLRVTSGDPGLYGYPVGWPY